MGSFVLALTGPSGSGKTTLATKLANELSKCVNIDADHIKHMVPSGFHVETRADGVEDWKYDEWILVGDNIGLLATNFVSKGFNVIINGYIDELGWCAIEKHIAITHKVLLLPGLEVNQYRDKQRPGDEPMGEFDVKRHHDYFSNNSFWDSFIKLDSSEHTIEETAEEIKRLLA